MEHWDLQDHPAHLDQLVQLEHQELQGLVNKGHQDLSVLRVFQALKDQQGLKGQMVRQETAVQMELLEGQVHKGHLDLRDLKDHKVLQVHPDLQVLLVHQAEVELQDHPEVLERRDSKDLLGCQDLTEHQENQDQ
jgi:hypothetical protein